MIIEVIRGYIMCYKATNSVHYLRQARNILTEYNNNRTISIVYKLGA